MALCSDVSRLSNELIKLFPMLLDVFTCLVIKVQYGMSFLSRVSAESRFFQDSFSDAIMESKVRKNMKYFGPLHTMCGF